LVLANVAIVALLCILVGVEFRKGKVALSRIYALNQFFLEVSSSRLFMLQIFQMTDMGE
jgi:hypothetical protein